MLDHSTPSDTLGHCRWCGVQVNTDSFRDLRSLREYRIGASCQRCQDLVFLGTGDDGRPLSHPVRHGVVVAPVFDDDVPSEVALLPFLFVVAPRHLVWEPRYTVRAGPELLPVDPWVELEAMHDDWDEYNVRVLCVRSLADPVVRAGLGGCDFVIGLDAASLRVAAQLCPTVRQRDLVNLSAALPWEEGYGARLLPLAPFLRAQILDTAVGTADACRASGLRLCALLARLLSLRATAGYDAGRTAFEMLLLGHGGRFDEWSWEDCDGRG